MIVTNLLGRRAKIGGVKGGYDHEIVTVFIEDGAPCVVLMSADGHLHTQLAVQIEVEVKWKTTDLADHV